MTRPFRVVTHRNWLAKQFEPMGAVQDFGWDIDPNTAQETLWWAPGAWTASALKAGVRLPLLSCGADWMVKLPKEYKGRKIQNKLQRDIFPGKSRAVFAKLPEAKVESVEAKLYSENIYLKQTLRQYHLPEDTVWQLQDPVEFMAEVRFWVANGKIVAESPYRWNDLIWGSEDFEETVNFMSVFHWLKVIRELAHTVVGDVPGPPGYVLDVGLTTDGDPLVVEANAAWSSGPYDGDPAGIYESIVAAHDFEGKYPQWAWQPQPVYDKVGPLKVTRCNYEMHVHSTPHKGLPSTVATPQARRRVVNVE